MLPLHRPAFAFLSRFFSQALFRNLLIVGFLLPAGLLPGQDAADSLALVDFYRATGGRQWVQQEGWLTEAPFTTWFGVEASDGRVVGLFLPGNRLVGKVPRSFRQLDLLRNLDLSDNRLDGILGLELFDELPAQVNLTDNLLTFTDLAPLFIKFGDPEVLPVVPQKTQDTTTYYIKLGDSEIIRPPVSDTLPAEPFTLRYAWSRRGSSLENDPNFTTSPGSPYLGMQEMTTRDTGLYLLTITAPDSPLGDLEIKVPLDVRALCEEEETGNCYVCGEFILDAGGADPDALADFLEKEREDGARIDSCLCVDSLYLLHYDDLDPDFLEARRDRAESEIEPEGTDLNIKKVNRILRGLDLIKDAVVIDLTRERGENGSGKEVRVGLVDSGTEQQHSLLGGVFWRNTAEAIDGLDTDGNCAPDDSLGFDFARVMGYPGPMDREGHGTHMAGIISYDTPADVELQIIDSKFLDTEAGSTLFDAVCAIYYAMGQKARVINLSWGYLGQPVDILKRALTEARSENIVVVSSAGNDQNDNDAVAHWPSGFSPDFDNMISVAAVKQTPVGDYAFADGFSNYGKGSVDIAAPGALVESTFPGDSTAVLSGTSMAAGFVTRTVAHMRALYPGASSDVIVGCLLSSGTSLPSLSARVATGSMLNDTSALNCMLTDLEPLRAEGPTLQVYPQPFREFLRLDLSSLGGGQATFRLFTSMGQLVASRRFASGGVEEIRFADGSLPAGMYLFQVEYEGKIWTGRMIRQP